MRIVATAVLVSSVISAAPRAVQAADQAAVLEAALEQRVSFWLSQYGRESRLVVCVGLEEAGKVRDLPGFALSRLVRDVSVRPASACHAAPDGTTERATGRPAVLLLASRVEWRAADDAVVTVRHHRTGTASGSQRIRVVRERDSWIALGPLYRGAPV